MNNDLISRSALLESFEKRCMNDCDFCPFAIYAIEKPVLRCALIEKAPAVDAVPVGAIENAPTIDAMPKWISVDERLPENQSLVLAYAHNSYELVYWNAYYEIWEHEFRWFNKGEVSHWMPLPKPPKENNT